MKISMKTIITALAVSGVIATAANATTYVSTRKVGAAIADISITTDGTLGALSEDNVTAWTISLSNPSNTTVMTEANSTFYVFFTQGFVATATDLLFDFGHSSSAVVFSSDASSASYCLTSYNTYCGGNQPGEVVEIGQTYRVEGLGNTAIASVAMVPEPATWAMAIGGFALAGAAMRRRASPTARFA